MPVVREYWAGVLDRLQADVETLSRLLRHHGERGRANEAALVALLESFVPRRFDVGTGLLIDSADHYSKQMDIVVTERNDEPAILAQTTHLLHPVEAALACIEVKTTLSTDEIKDCLAKRRSLLNLQPRRPYLDGSRQPLFFVLAYRTTLKPQTISRALLDADDDVRPDFICVLQPGLVAGTSQALMKSGGYSAGLTLLQSAAPSEPDGPALFDRAVDATNRTEERMGRHYPLVEFEGSTYLGDPARALLLFIEALARLIAIKNGKLPPTLTEYLDADARRLALL